MINNKDSTPLPPLQGGAFDTIAAISTPRGKAALAIIRISGVDTFEIINKITQKDYTKIPIDKMIKASFFDEESIIDDGMICLRKAPHSYTGEDMAEFFCHGNDFIVSQVLEQILLYCRIAESGEFTFRAFLNNKIDLTQAEAIGNLLEAQTKQAQRVALSQLEGRLYSKIKNILDEITEIRILFELAIDFSEDEVPDFDIENISSKIESISESLQNLMQTADEGILITDGIKICLVGAPNVGKSSIFNAFLQTERAIITPIPGTTRDYLEESFSLGGYLIRLFDTAGIRESEDHIEKIGIERSKQILNDADIILHITDPNSVGQAYMLDKDNSLPPLTNVGEKVGPAYMLDKDNSLPPLTNGGEKVGQAYMLDKKKYYKIINKSDLLNDEEIQNWIDKGYIPCSAVQKSGLDVLKATLLKDLKLNKNEIDSGIITNARQLACAKKAYNHLEKVKVAIQSQMGIDFIAFDIMQVSNALEEIIGRISNEDILSTIFSNFCIGK